MPRSCRSTENLVGAQDGQAISDLLEAFGDPCSMKRTSQPGRSRTRGELPQARALSCSSMRHTVQHANRCRIAAQGDVPGRRHRFSALPIPHRGGSDLLQQHLNYFPELEEEAESLARRLNRRRFALRGTQCLPAARPRDRGESAPGAMRSALRRYDLTSASCTSRKFCDGGVVIFNSPIRSACSRSATSSTVLPPIRY